MGEDDGIVCKDDDDDDDGAVIGVSGRLRCMSVVSFSWSQHHNTSNEAE